MVPLSGTCRAAERFDHGALAGAVFPEQCQNLAAPELEADVAHRLYAREGFANTSHLEKRGGGGGERGKHK